MPRCQLCDYVCPEAQQVSSLVCCWTCERRARELPPEAVAALVEMEAGTIELDFWDWGWRPVAQPAEVAPGLFIGDLDHACNVASLNNLGVCSVVNLCPDRLHDSYACCASRLSSAGIWMLTAPAHDSWNFNVVEQVLEGGVLEFIEGRMHRGGVLVNCWGGVNRSAAVVVAFLMLKQEESLLGAFRRTMGLRGTVLTNRSFRVQLLDLALSRGCALGIALQSGTTSGRSQA